MKEECLICKAPLEYLMEETSKDPIAIIEKMMDMPFCHMHGPEHHVMVGDSFLSILAAADFVKEHFAIEMERPEVVCRFSFQNNQCIGKRCPFSKAR